jgi:hypothetical protein
MEKEKTKSLLGPTKTCQFKSHVLNTMLVVGASMSGSVGCDSIKGDGVVVHGVIRVDLGVHKKSPG